MTTVVAVTTAAPSQSRALSISFAYFAVFLAQGLIVGAFGPLLPALVVGVGAPLSAMSWLLVARSLGALAISAQGGRLFDRWPGHPLMALALFGCALMLVLLPLAGTLWSLIAVITLLGTGLGVINLGSNTLLYWVHREQVAPYMNMMHFCFGVGCFLSPLMVAWLLNNHTSGTMAFWLLALSMLPVVGYLLYLPSPLDQPVTTAIVAQPIDYRLVALFVVFFFFYVGAEVGFGSWLYSYVLTAGLGDAATGAYLTSAFWGSLTVGRLLAVPLAMVLRPRSVLALDLLGALLGVGLLLLWPASTAVLWAGTLLLGFSMASVFPTALSFVQRRIPVTGRVTGYFMVGSGFGSIVLPWLIGMSLEWFGIGVMLPLIALDLLLAGLVYGVLLLGWKEPVQTLRSLPTQ